MVPRGLHSLYRRPLVERTLARHFNRAYYYGAERRIFGRSWLGHTTLKYPTDLWAYQEMITAIRPAAVLETGTYKGGSALYLATVLDALGAGKVVSVDVMPMEGLPEHPRITYITGSSIDCEVVDRVRGEIGTARPVLVILDADHHRDHVLGELRAYADLVDPGSYLVVEDTCVNGQPILPDFGPGPGEAVAQFLSERGDFVADRSRENMLLTANPRGFLRRIS